MDGARLSLSLDLPKRRRRRLSVRLSTLFWLVLVIALGVGWASDHWRLKHQIASAQGERSGWSVWQVVGPPNTLGFGDKRTAWASNTRDGQAEWLVLEFPRAVVPVAIVVHETHCPGALIKATRVEYPASKASVAKERLLWEGVDPVPASDPGGIARLPVTTHESVQSVKLHLDSVLVPGWNEIDAVALEMSDGGLIWSSSAYASSSYGKNRGLPLMHISGFDVIETY
ncbi:hypothetical protein Mal64_04360 [Pseudobythopirellula maris]|uniref:Uncharacterized protein n=2 Tax=Pseudobythopirellula maris TaxID=2527991 RepID=A0A5C5ZUY3_9BACT|nr:hypothetical protein Mal64_04360 [Pseudobythopirellula maris]